MNSYRGKKDVVLIVDDSPDTLSMLNDTLDQAGITVLVALEGAQALTIAANITPDVILMDALMPNMDGFETCRKLKENRDLAHIPVIFMTGLSDTESIVKGFTAGGVDYITKPIKGDELIARMLAHLSNARLTLSARVALDSAGQFLFSAAADGNLLWATPQAYHLLEEAGLDSQWLSENFPTQLRQLLAPHFNKEKGLLIKAAEKALEIRYISQTGTDEYLLQLIDMERPSDVDRLRSALPITERESEVLLWIAHGKTNREIGTILSMSPRTANKHLEQIFRKLNVENRTAAAVIALKHLQN
ncbi:response regulator [Zhongshania sp.]|jgi:DNA-binding NarL/FixJ family response regulator|uniref:response regulator n=1 Tax=Zhongshania sp. TaxID=1971902 RepID=UPI0039E371EC